MVDGCTLTDFRTIWSGKPVLRAIYHDLYRRLRGACHSGRTLEIGGGSGNLKESLGEVISTDIQAAPWLDVVADAERLPFADASFDNIVMVDVLHHLPRLHSFLTEAARVLRPGGRIVMIEPAITPVSRLVYGLFHHEPVIMGVDPLADQPLSSDDPWAANQAIPTLLLRDAVRLEGAVPALRLARSERLSLFTYPLSGGFKRWSLIRAAWVPALLAIEDALMGVLGPLMAFRLLAVIERRED